MIEHVYTRVARARGLDRVVVLTDDERIAEAVQRFGGEWEMTPEDCASGTDRIAWAARSWNASAVINIQGDEPLIDPALVRRVATTLAGRDDAAIATACHRIDDVAEVFNPNVVKVVRDANGNALYFSRAPIPFAREGFAATPPALPADVPVYRHYGLYAYRVAFLRAFPSLPEAPIEAAEALEQLRALWHGYRIVVDVAQGAPAPGVDTAHDLERVRALFAAAGGNPN